MGPLRRLLRRNNPAANPVHGCPPNKWQLEVKLTREEKPPQCDGAVDIELDDAGMIDWSSETFGANTERTSNFEGNAPQTVQVTAQAGNLDWYCDTATPTVNLVLGTKSYATLHFKPKPWVKFKVVDDDTNTQLAGLTLQFTLPAGPVTRITTANATTDAMRLDPTVTNVPVVDLDNTVNADIWEFVKIESES
jgi:hypothetical protein